jgi:hypothetical protein
MTVGFGVSPKSADPIDVSNDISMGARGLVHKIHAITAGGEFHPAPRTIAARTMAVCATVLTWTERAAM